MKYIVIVGCTVKDMQFLRDYFSGLQVKIFGDIVGRVVDKTVIIPVEGNGNHLNVFKPVVIQLNGHPTKLPISIQALNIKIACELIKRDLL